MSTKRIRSSGDGPHGGGISVKSAKKADKFNCTVCSKLISRKTKHPASACQNYIKRNSTDKQYLTSLPPELSGATVRSPIVTTATVVETTRRKGTGGAQNDSSSDDSSYDSDFDLQHWDAYEDVTG